MFKEISPYDIKDNVFRLLDKDWMLITAGTPDHFNPMTASWGHLGILWNLPVAIAYIRPQRHTFGFANDSERYTLTFFPEEHRDILNFCGSRSGRDHDKVKATGLKPLFTDTGGIYYEQARLVMECRKIYQDRLKPENFIDPSIAKKNYPKDDFHTFYMGEVVRCLVRD
jgi:flavin reductase (DIM6/NTAB) family NADH-FMN oxidoreductase RutF